jgi:hypothetical protein|tara:strand:+ start:498 stop:1079 length:582 start_codon:yes stop_codon:yes gene_type:complete
MKTINIHGKQYVEVKERIKYFRENFKDWSLTSEVIDLTEDRCVIKATISNEKGRVIASGIAYENKGSSYINKTSFIENCETSAWGRALANIGIGLDVAIASADEVLNAKAQDKPKKPKIEKLSDAKFSAMVVAIGEGKGDTVRERLCKYKISKKQQAKIDELLTDKKVENGVLSIIDELNSIEVPTEIKNINN